jgi:hypothetical protein
VYGAEKPFTNPHAGIAEVIVGPQQMIDHMMPIGHFGSSTCTMWDLSLHSRLQKHTAAKERVRWSDFKPLQRKMSNDGPHVIVLVPAVGLYGWARAIVDPVPGPISVLILLGFDESIRGNAL